MNIMVMLCLLLSLIQTQEEETCVICHEHRDWEESNYFIYPHSTSVFEASDPDTNRNTMHLVHLTCLSNYADVSEEFEASNFTKLVCTYCMQDISCFVLISIQKELHNLKSPEKSETAVKNIGLWYKLLIKIPRIAHLLVGDQKNALRSINKILAFIRDCYPTTIKENKHKILVTFIERLLCEYKLFPLRLEDWDYCEALSGCSSQDILLAYDEWYSKMPFYMRNRFNRFIIGFITNRSQGEIRYEKSPFTEVMARKSRILPVVDILEVWKNIFYFSDKTGKYTQADKIYEEADCEFQGLTTLKEVSENPQSDVFIFNQVADSEQSSKEKNFVFNAVFLIPAIICKVKEENITTSFKKYVFIKTIKFLHSNLNELHDNINLTEFLFMYMQDHWYNVIYDKTSPLPATKIENLLGKVSGKSVMLFYVLL